MVLFWETEVTTFERILKEWGYPTMVLAVGGFVLWRIGKAVVPYVADYFKNLIATQKAQAATLEQQLKIANDTIREERNEFTDRSQRDQKIFIETLQQQNNSHNDAMRRHGEAIADALNNQSKAIDSQSQAIKELTSAIKGDRKQ